MYRCLLIACLGFCCAIYGSAQSVAPTPWKFRSVEYVGMLFGQQGKYGQFQTINGLYKGPWFLGVGVGLDYYQVRSLPLFLSVTRELMKAGNGFFVSLDGGPNFPLSHQPQYVSYGRSQFTTGPFYSAGLGYKLRLSTLHREHALSLLTAYSYKEFKEKMEDDPQNTHYNYRDRRWSLKIGLTL